MTGGPTVSGRWAARAVATVALLGRPRAHAVWPEPENPLLAVDLRHPAAARWLHCTFVDARRAGRLAARVWSAVHAHAVLFGGPSRWIVAAAEDGLGRSLPRPGVAFYSPSGAASGKVTFFVFERTGQQPAAVVKTTMEVEFARRLASEAEILEDIRRRLNGAPDVAASLPAPPLWSRWTDGRFATVEAYDPVAASSSGGSDPRELAFVWLRRFQECTTVRRCALEEGERRDLVDRVRSVWSRHRPERSQLLTTAVSRLLEELAAVPVPRCAVHGDFHRGNLGRRGDALRIVDWEWAAGSGLPFIDHWMYEIAELRTAGPTASAADAALRRVERRLETLALDSRYARATLAPTVAELVSRERALTGAPGIAEYGVGPLLEAVERLVTVAVPRHGASRPRSD